ncbi:MAG TPA: hypothetical protein VHB97_19085 [Polyangia bacterium]|jgi:hypothetical protein|nr:hypothetical protein [Polyangia bacterium]
MKRRLVLLLALAVSGCKFHAAGLVDMGEDAGVGAGVGDDLAVATGGDSMPKSIIELFHAQGCPSGWVNYPLLQGRTIVPAPDVDGGSGDSWGDPLADGEDREHGHDGGVFTSALGSTSFAGIAGGGLGVGKADTVTIAVTGSSDRAALPYVDLLACKKVASPVAGSKPLPTGLLGYFEYQCPAGWNRASSLEGRYLVGLPAGGAVGASFGGPSLASGEGRTHTHNLTGSLPTQSQGVALVSGCCADGYAKNATVTFSGTTPPASAALPYLQLVACVSN